MMREERRVKGRGELIVENKAENEKRHFLEIKMAYKHKNKNMHNNH